MIYPFSAWRVCEKYASAIASLPYDVWTDEDAQTEIAKHPDSFLTVDKPEANFDPIISFDSDLSYQTASKKLMKLMDDKKIILDGDEAFYLYAQTMEGRTQLGLVCLCDCEDYISGNIKVHELTRENKERDRTRHIEALQAHTGPIFLIYKKQDRLKEILTNIQKEKSLYDFYTEDDIRHCVWKIKDRNIISEIQDLLQGRQYYIADGHHRNAAAVNYYRSHGNDRPKSRYYLSVLFDERDLEVFAYHRLIKDCSFDEEKLQRLKQSFHVTTLPRAILPKKRGEMIFFSKQWTYQLEVKDDVLTHQAVEDLDVSIAQLKVMDELFNIKDPRNDPRLDFYGGKNAFTEIKQQVEQGNAFGLLFYPVSVLDLFSVADENQMMPPKSTWFEPKLRSGLFLHQF